MGSASVLQVTFSDLAMYACGMGIGYVHLKFTYYS